MNQLGLGWGYPTLGFRPLKIKKYCVPSLTPTTKFKGTRKNMSEIWEPFNNTAQLYKTRFKPNEDKPQMGYMAIAGGLNHLPYLLSTSVISILGSNKRF